LLTVDKGNTVLLENAGKGTVSISSISETGLWLASAALVVTDHYPRLHPVAHQHPSARHHAEW
jgi:hypothetical protein